jgi:hypothetical protein
MGVLFGSLLFSVEMITIGALLKVGYHMGGKILKSCGEKESPKPKADVKGGRKRVLEHATGNELSIFPG